MTFGRPPKIPKEIAKQAEYPLARFPTSGNSVNYEFFIAYCKLHSIIGDLLEYSDKRDNPPENGGSHPSTPHSWEKLEELCDIETKLSVWKGSLGHHLHISASPDYVDEARSPFVKRQAIILQGR
jgi:hypothetical protein